MVERIRRASGDVDQTSSTHLGGFHSHGGTPNSWMVFLIENPIKMDDLGVALF
jgi:hypothetical protein